MILKINYETFYSERYDWESLCFDDVELNSKLNYETGKYFPFLSFLTHEEIRHELP